MNPVTFAVGDEPFLLWDGDVAERTRDFLSGIDSEYFAHVIQTNQNAEDEARAAVAIRLALHHATETMFSFLGALVQAPDCPYAWIARCSTSELRKVVKRIGEDDRSLPSKFKLPSLGWNSIAALVFEGFEPATEGQRNAIRNFSLVWSRLAADQFTEAVADEYNALKHGFRTMPGGFRLHMGPPATSSEPPPDSEMRLLGESKHGAMFYKVVRLDGMGGRHISSQLIAVNWSTTQDALLLQLIELSIHNIVTRMKTANRFPRDQCRYKVPEGDDFYVLPWKHSPGVTRFTFPESLPQELPDVSKATLLRKLREALDGNG